MRIMLDTNILVSMIFFPSSQTRELAKRAEFFLLTFFKLSKKFFTHRRFFEIVH